MSNFAIDNFFRDFIYGFTAWHANLDYLSSDFIDLILNVL